MLRLKKVQEGIITQGFLEVVNILILNVQKRECVYSFPNLYNYLFQSLSHGTSITRNIPNIPRKYLLILQSSRSHKS